VFVRLGLKSLPSTNTLAHYQKILITAVKSFITLAPGHGWFSNGFRRREHRFEYGGNVDHQRLEIEEGPTSGHHLRSLYGPAGRNLIKLFFHRLEFCAIVF
jgi:hypothetical protein